MPFNDRIKEARQNKKLTQEQLAHSIGVAKSTLAGYEKGSREPNVLTTSKIMESLNIDANYLYQDEINLAYDDRATPKEMENLIKKYRVLDEHGKKTVDTILNSEYERCKSSQKNIDDVKLKAIARGGGTFEISEEELIKLIEGLPKGKLPDLEK